MIDSRKLDDLHPAVMSRVISFMVDYQQQTGIEILWASTYRDSEMQASLYAKGRTAPGNIVTHAMPGHSAHNYRLAANGYPMVGGKPLFQAHNAKGVMLNEWVKYGKIAVNHGLEWAGNWQSFVEYPHVQYTGQFSLAQIIENPNLVEQIK